MAEAPHGGWLLLIHQIPPKPSYLRVKIWRRLRNLGAVSIKNSVYALPASDETHEDFQWVQREIVEGGGEATICEARFVDGLDDDQVSRLFNAERDADYRALAADAKKALAQLPDRGAPAAAVKSDAATQLRRLDRRLRQIADIDFFAARGRAEAEAAIAAIAKRVSPAPAASPDGALDADAFKDKVWVTREKVFVDRIASAWLIRRFVDADARFRFVAGREHKPKKNEIRFDMFEAEFTHDGDKCTFEVMAERFRPDDAALSILAHVVHDIDLKDGKFGRDEAKGLATVVTGIAAEDADDETRLREGGIVFDALYRAFSAVPH